MLVVNSPVRAVVHRNHHLARSPRVTLAELAREQLVCRSTNDGSHPLHGEIMRRIFTARGLKIGRIMCVEGVDAFRVALEAGLGVSLIPEFGVLANSRVLVLKPLSDTGLDLSVKLSALWRDDPASRTTANFVSVMRETVNSRKQEEERSQTADPQPGTLAGAVLKSRRRHSASIKR
jgi:DNA-binding transcriptional LysR family regulator